VTSVFTKRLGSAANTAGANPFQVPAGKVWIVKCVTFYNRTNGASDNAGWLIQEAGIAFVVGAPFGGVWRTQTWLGTHALVAGEHLILQAFVGNWDIIASGYELTA
jgi:hypothetical protein